MHFHQFSIDGFSNALPKNIKPSTFARATVGNSKTWPNTPGSARKDKRIFLTPLYQTLFYHK